MYKSCHMCKGRKTLIVRGNTIACPTCKGEGYFLMEEEDNKSQ